MIEFVRVYLDCVLMFVVIVGYTHAWVKPEPLKMYDWVKL